MTNSNAWCNIQGNAGKYDNLIPKLIPFYNEQNKLIMDLVPFESDRKFRALDLGAGTGALSELILSKFPAAGIVAFDLSEKMLDICRDKLEPFIKRVVYKLGDFSIDNIGSNYDIVVSGLAIHHLRDSQKQILFKRIFQSLNPNTLFINRDIIRGTTPYLTNLYENLWRHYIKQNGEDDHKWFAKYLEEDFPATVSEQSHWLEDAGFSDIDCHWRYLNFAIFGGRKP